MVPMYLIESPALFAASAVLFAIPADTLVIPNLLPSIYLPRVEL